MQTSFEGKSTKNKAASLEQLKADLHQAESIKDRKAKVDKLTQIISSYLFLEEWDLAMEAAKMIPDERKRNLMIADLIEEHLIPAHEIKRAKEFVKFLTPLPETKPIILIRLALAENNKESALQIAEQLPTPQSRNFALLHIAEAYLLDGEKEKAIEIGERMVENARTISDSDHRSYTLRDIVKNIFLANHDKARAKKAAALIPNETLKNRLLHNIDASKD